MMMVMMMMKINCFCRMFGQQKALRSYFQPVPLSEILTVANLRPLRAGFEPGLNLQS